MKPDPSCVFCKIAAGTIPTDKVLENDLVVAFKDARPSAETHVLLIPRGHVGSFTENIDLAVWDSLRQAARQVITDLNLEKAYKLVFNGGSYQHVPHLHWHLLGGKMTAHLREEV
ncbi:MAG TPA: HIT domain-containing protein [Patescibacteria group bacterium]|nr:HIT domain-containing protein [Patescibacteria group bacterium]